MFVINVKGNIISVQETEPITSGSVNVYRCRFAFDDSWEGFFRSAVFRVGPMVKTVPLNDEDSCELPWELLAKKSIGLPVEVSVYGSKDETEILPTIWDKMGRIRSGSEPGEDAKEPTPTAYDQLTNLVRIYSDRVTEYREVAEESAQAASLSAQAAAEAVSGINASVSAAAASAASAKASETTVAKSAETAVQSAKAAQESESKVLTAASEVAANATSAQQSAERAAASEEVAKSAIASAEEAKEAATVAAAQAVVASDAATASTHQLPA